MVCCENGEKSSGPKGLENFLRKRLNNIYVNKALYYAIN